MHAFEEFNIEDFQDHKNKSIYNVMSWKNLDLNVFGYFEPDIKINDPEHLMCYLIQGSKCIGKCTCKNFSFIINRLDDEEIEELIKKQNEEKEYNFSSSDDDAPYNFSSADEDAQYYESFVRSYSHGSSCRSIPVKSSKQERKDVIKRKCKTFKCKKDSSMCVICQEKREKGELTILLPCFHMFHEKCMIAYSDSLKSNSKLKCPLCKLEL